MKRPLSVALAAAFLLASWPAVPTSAKEQTAALGQANDPNFDGQPFRPPLAVRTPGGAQTDPSLARPNQPGGAPGAGDATAVPPAPGQKDGVQDKEPGRLRTMLKTSGWIMAGAFGGSILGFLALGPIGWFIGGGLGLTAGIFLQFHQPHLPHLFGHKKKNES